MTLGPCPSCQRHVRIAHATCVFCGAPTAHAAAGAVTPVSRRELTRAAIFAGAALMIDGCGGADAETPPPDDDTTSGGDDGADDGSNPTYEGVWTADADAGVDAGPPDAGDGEVDLEGPDFQDPRRRQLPQCVYDGTCPAPPYGAPPADVTLV